MSYINILAISITILAGLLAFLQSHLPPNVERVAGPACLFLALCASVLIYYGAKEAPEILITSYSNEQTVRDFARINPDGEVQIFPVQFVTNHSIGPSDEVVLFMRVAGGDQYWVSGNPVTAVNVDQTGKGQIDAVTLGQPDDGNLRYELVLAVVRDKTLSAGANLDEIPGANIICSDHLFLIKDV
jgi:hypothetical protein